MNQSNRKSFKRTNQTTIHFHKQSKSVSIERTHQIVVTMSFNQTPGGGYCNPNLTSKMNKLYLKTKLADVHFVFHDEDESERVPAHKMLLAIRSDVFEAMFFGEMKETGDITIVDASADAFKEFLQFFYLNKIDLTMENISDVVNLCKKYGIDECLMICEAFLKESLNIENVCSAYGLAILFDLDNLKSICKELIVEDTEAVFKSSSFLECHRSVLGHILMSNELSCSETMVLEACINWVKAASGRDEVTREMVQNHLNDLFYEIRFGSMNMKDFAALTGSYGKLFTLDEYQEIVQTINLEEFVPKIFKNKNSRQTLFNTSQSSIESFSSSLSSQLDQTIPVQSKP